MAPAQIGEAGVIPVGGDPVPARFESQRGQIRVCNHVDVEEDHRGVSMRSRRAALSSRSTPCWRPEAPKVVSLTGAARLEVPRRPSASRNASSMTARSGRLALAARRLACASRSYGRSIVVLMHHSIQTAHNYIKLPALTQDASQHRKTGPVIGLVPKRLPAPPALQQRSVMRDVGSQPPFDRAPVAPLAPVFALPGGRLPLFPVRFHPLCRWIRSRSFSS